MWIGCHRHHHNRWLICLQLRQQHENDIIIVWLKPLSTNTRYSRSFFKQMIFKTQIFWFTFKTHLDRDFSVVVPLMVDFFSLLLKCHSICHFSSSTIHDINFKQNGQIERKNRKKANKLMLNDRSTSTRRRKTVLVRNENENDLDDIFLLAKHPSSVCIRLLVLFALKWMEMLFYGHKNMFILEKINRFHFFLDFTSTLPFRNFYYFSFYIQYIFLYHSIRERETVDYGLWITGNRIFCIPLAMSAFLHTFNHNMDNGMDSGSIGACLKLRIDAQALYLYL